ncbi:SAL1 phosphatase-like [Salvia splendens]|uniref:SAL1 phosphatase-like n=1 Tax=Salvia splendens TaxID=180675 RepID=UPI001C27A9DF|nr:SAL1 phosphatase-like [Salvia splendens]
MNTSFGNSGAVLSIRRGAVLHITARTRPHLNSKSKLPLLSSLSLSTTTSRAARPTASMSYHKQLAAAKKAASVAARLCQKVQTALLQSDVQSKSDKSPVTVADYGSQAIVSLILEKELTAIPLSLVAEEDSGDLRKEESRETLHRITELVNDTFASDGTINISPVSEEDVLKAIDTGKSEGGPHGQHWVLDPIDGTKGFVRGQQYAIALALLDEGKVVLGVLACPNLPLSSIAKSNFSSSEDKVGCLFFAEVGGGTYMQSLDGSPPTKVHVSTNENLEEASFFESYEAAHSSHDLSSLIATKLGVKAPPVRIDSQAKYGALSRGDGSIYLRFPRRGYVEKIWDHAAGYIVVAEAGGVVNDAGGKPLDFSKGRYLDLDTGIVVTNQKLMPTLLKAVQESISEKASSL